MSWPLAGIRVVALEQAVAAPLCTRHLADLGADVVKVERPDGGDFARHYDSVVKGSVGLLRLAQSRQAQRDARLTRTRRIARCSTPCSARADVFVHNLGPGAAERLGWAGRRSALRSPD